MQIRHQILHPFYILLVSHMVGRATVIWRLEIQIFNLAFLWDNKRLWSNETFFFGGGEHVINILIQWFVLLLLFVFYECVNSQKSLSKTSFFEYVRKTNWIQSSFR